jgi:hypothetical protein
MPARLCIHIGMPKTGTSLIQAVLAGMRDALAKESVWVPASFLQCHRLAVAATPENDAIQKRADFRDITAAMPLAQALEQPAAAAARSDIVILSSEYFSECSPRRLRSLLDSAGLRAADVSIVAALRRQDRILVSGFNQDVKALNRTTPLAWSPSRIERHDWYARLQPWAEEFGKAAIKVQVFDRAAAGRQSLTCQVLDACGVIYDAALVQQHEERHSRSENRSLPAELLAFKFFANAVTKQGQLDWLINEALARRVGGVPYQLEPATARSIIDHYRESNRRVAAEYLGESGDLFDDRVEEGGKTTLAVSPATIAVLLSICAAELHRLRALAGGAAGEAKSR